MGSPALHQDLFNPVEAIIENFRATNQAAQLGFKANNIDALADSVPEFDGTKPLHALFIYWTLGDLQRSANANIKAIRHVFGAEQVCVGGKFRTGPSYLRQHKTNPGFLPYRLGWGIINLGYSCHDNAYAPTPGEYSAGFELFAACTQHPEYTRQLGSSGAMASGLMVSTDGRERYDASPKIRPDGADIEVSVYSPALYSGNPDGVLPQVLQVWA